jgi:membrane-bound lytic murein transglycosylase B
MTRSEPGGATKVRGIVLFLAYVLGLLLMAAAYGAQGAPVPAVPPPPAITTPAVTAPEDTAFAAFLRDFRATALTAGIRPEIYDRAMAGLHRDPRIAEHNLNQPEFARPIWSYIDSAVSENRVRNGRALLVGDGEMLARIQARFHVPPELLISIWGNESDFGRGQGRYNMFAALATLAYDGPRADYARSQLIAALKMMQRENYDPAAMLSSWAGAFGQTQFVPTTFLSQAVDGDGDGKIDLWRNPADALASTAHVLASAGWVDGQPWGYEVKLPRRFAFDQADLDIVKSVAAWRRAGVRTIDGERLVEADADGSIYLPAGAHGPAFLVFANFKVILKYNNAASYALAVSLLADRIKGTAGIVAEWPRHLAALNRSDRLALQTALIALGYDIGKADGMIGARTRAALRDWQKAHGVAADGFATPELLVRIADDARDNPHARPLTPRSNAQ